MAQPGKIRQLQGGGCSLCRASDENVGKRRCRHILDGVTMDVKKVNGMNFVDIKGKMNNEDVKFSAKATEKDVRNYITSLSKGLSKKEKASILDAMREFQ
jgi:hypothetical protein